jgi:hypothetical protein
MDCRRKCREGRKWVCSVAVCGSETWNVGENVERVVNGFETWCWRRMLKIKWADRISNGKVLQRAKRRKNTFTKF